MLNRIFASAVILLLAASSAFANQSNKVTLEVGRTASNSGQQMYTSYCAPCHGTDGRGNGPMASSLRTRPTDLTQLSRMNNGKFPDTHIVSILQFGSVHQTTSMPQWGPILAKMNVTNPQDRLLRISNLSRYLSAIQVR